MATDTHGRVMRQSAIILAFGWVLAPLQFAIAVIVARVVGPEGKGALALLTGLTAILSSLIAFGVPSGAAALYPRDAHSKASVVATSFALTLAASGLLLGLYFVAGDALLAPVLTRTDLESLEASWILLTVLTVVPTALAAVADVILIAANAMRVYAVRSATAGMLTVALTWLWTLQLGWGVTGALASYPVAATAGLALFARWWWGQPDLSGFRVDLACARSLLRIGVQQHVVAIIALVAKRIDVLLLATMLGLAEAGIYAAAILIPQTLVTVPRATMWPLVSTISASNGAVSDAVLRICRAQVLLMSLGCVVLAVVAPWLVAILFGEAFATAVTPLRWALAGVPFTPLTVTANAIFTARERPALSIGPAALGTAVQVAVAVLGIPRWGATACAVALSANHVVTALIQLAVARADGVRVTTLIRPSVGDFDVLVKALRARLSA